MQQLKVKTQTKEKEIRANIPVTFLRYLQSRNNERVLEVVLVYNGVDRFDTIIEPEGMQTDPSTVTIDYNHKGVDTGAYLSDLKVVRNYELDGINGKKQVLETALVGQLHIPETAEMFYHTKDGEKKSNGNLHEAVSKGHIKSVSVDFRPKRQATNTKTGITTYKTWDLIRLSVLDVTPGQPYSGIKVIRYFDTSHQKANDINSKININIMSKKLNLNLQVDSEELKRNLDKLAENEAFKDLSEDQLREIGSAISESLVEEKEIEEAEEEPKDEEPEPDLRTYMKEIRGYMKKNEERMKNLEDRMFNFEKKKEEKRAEPTDKEKEMEILRNAEKKLEEKKAKEEEEAKNQKRSDKPADNKRQTQANALGMDNKVQYSEELEEKLKTRSHNKYY